MSCSAYQATQTYLSGEGLDFFLAKMEKLIETGSQQNLLALKTEALLKIKSASLRGIVCNKAFIMLL